MARRAVILGLSERLRWRARIAGSLVVAGVGALASPAALAADQPPAPAAQPPTVQPPAAQQRAVQHPGDAGTSAIETEIAGWVARDRDADPRATLAALTELETRSEAADGVSPRARGELAAMIAASHFAVQDVPAAVAALDRAELAYAADGNAADKRAEVFNNRAVLLRRLRRYVEGEASAREAVRLRTELYGANHVDVASARSTLANLLYSQGKMEEAVEQARAAVASLESASGENHLALVQRLDTLASILDESGLSRESLQVAIRTEALAREHLGLTHNWYQYALNTLTQAQLKSGLYSDAIPNARTTITVREAQFGREHPFTQASVMVLATALEETGQLEEASALAIGAMALLRDHTRLMDVGTVAGFHSRMLRLLAATGDWPGYDREEPASVAVVDQVVPADHWARANFHVLRADILNARGRQAEALALAEQWVPVMVERLPAQSKDRISAEILLIRLRQQAGDDLSQALEQAEPVINRLTEQFTALGLSENDIASIAQASGQPLLTYLDMAIEAGDADRIVAAAQLLNLSELSLAQRHRGSLTEDKENSSGAIAHAAIRDMARQLRYLDRRIAVDESSGADTLRGQRNQLEGQLQAATTTFRAQYPDYADLIRPAPASRAALAGMLGDDDLLALPVETGARGYNVIVRPDGSVAAHPFQSDDIAPKVAVLRAALENPAEDAFPFAAASQLTTTLLPGAIDAGGTLFVYGGGALASLPWSLLLTAPHNGPLAEAPWLIRSKAVQVVGNLGLAARAPAEAAPVARWQVRMAGVGGAQMPTGAAAPVRALFRSGGPDFTAISELPPLAEAPAELAAIADALPGRSDVLLVGAAALEERIKQTDLSRANVIAFATHGLVSGELRGLWEPALLLGTAPGSGEDGLLGASEIAQLRLGADWVILSACNTAAGGSSGAPAYSGLATAFAQAGARGLMLSHWRVRDDAAARLTVGTVRGAAAGMSRAEALRQTQLALMADGSVPGAAHPAIWAPFVIIEN